MKKSFLFCAFAAALLGLNGCKSSIPEVNVADVAKDLTPSSFAGTETRSKTVVDGLTISVDEWTIVDKEKSTIEHTFYSFGNKTAVDKAPVAYTYSLGEVAEGNLGVNYLFTPITEGAEPLNVLYWGNSLIFGKDSVTDSSAPIANLKKIDAAFSNTKWVLNEIDYHILYDTLKIEERDTVKHVAVIDGKKQWVIDTIIVKSITKIDADTIGYKSIHTTNYAFLRNESSYENTGTRAQSFEWYSLNADSTDVVLDKDSSALKNFHWGFNSVTSATRFALNIEDDETKEMTRIGCSALDVTKKFEVNISNYIYKLVTEED